MASERVAANRDRLAALPDGVVRKALRTFPDDRGDFTEFFRNEWQTSPVPVQWNISRSRANVLRGVHVHTRHWDYLCVTNGEIFVGLHDLRATSSMATRTAMLRLHGSELEVLAIPPGVAHGFYSVDHSTYVIGASSYYDPTDHRRCRWDCPELGLDWPCDGPDLSPADQKAPSYGELADGFRAAMAALRSHP
jgi:dTDP-4-dehydrorhamnose 3,5-epimerase